jgi:hypothetical protein
MISEIHEGFLGLFIKFNANQNTPSKEDCPEQGSEDN